MFSTGPVPPFGFLMLLAALAIVILLVVIEMKRQAKIAAKRAAALGLTQGSLRDEDLNAETDMHLRKMAGLSADAGVSPSVNRHRNPWPSTAKTARGARTRKALAKAAAKPTAPARSMNDPANPAYYDPMDYTPTAQETRVSPDMAPKSMAPKSMDPKSMAPTSHSMPDAGPSDSAPSSGTSDTGAPAIPSVDNSISFSSDGGSGGF